MRYEKNHKEIKLTFHISNKSRSVTVGVFIIVAYSMLTYDISKNVVLGFTADIISGLAVIGIALLMCPLFMPVSKKINYFYIACKVIEGLLMIVGGFSILYSFVGNFRSIIYENFHIYFFIVGALFFYILLLKSQIIPKFISIWGIISTILLFAITISKLFIIVPSILNILLAPMILNEIFLAFWLIFKGFKIKNHNE